MWRRVLFACLVVSTSAAADPVQADFTPHAELVVRAGASRMSTDSDLGPTPSGSGPCFDGELAWRFRMVSFGVFGAFYTLRDQTYSNDQSFATSNDARYELFDVGARVTLHSRDGLFFVGTGLAKEWVRESGRGSSCACANDYCDPCTPIYTDQRRVQWSSAPLFELHVGVTLRRMGPMSIDIMALVGVGSNPDDAGYGLATERLVMGARF